MQNSTYVVVKIESEMMRDFCVLQSEKLKNIMSVICQ